MCVTREGMVYVCNKRRDGVCVRQGKGWCICV